MFFGRKTYATQQILLIFERNKKHDMKRDIYSVVKDLRT